MTSPIETNNVVERLARFAETLSVNRHYMTAQSCMEVQNDLRALLTERQSLSDRIDVQNALLDRARWLMRPYCGADEALRIFCDDVTASLTQGGES